MSKSRWVTGRGGGVGAAIVLPVWPGGGGAKARAPTGPAGLRTRAPGLRARPGTLCARAAPSRPGARAPRAAASARSEPLPLLRTRGLAAHPGRRRGRAGAQHGRAGKVCRRPAALPSHAWTRRAVQSGGPRSAESLSGGKRTARTCKGRDVRKE